MVFRAEPERPLCQQPGELARLLVVARPLDRLAPADEMLVGVPAALPHHLPHQGLERRLRLLAAVDARGSEKNDSVLDALRLEAAQRLEVLGEDADRTRLVAVEEVLI